MDEVIGDIDVDLDGKFASIRTSETNLGKVVFFILELQIFFKGVFFLLSTGEVGESPRKQYRYNAAWTPLPPPTTTTHTKATRKVQFKSLSLYFSDYKQF